MDLLLTKYLKAEIDYEGVQRIETYTVPEAALREALLNAVAHKDYASGVPIQISVYDERVVFWNNGHLPEDWTVERLTAKHPSLPYNPDVANAFFRAGMIEAWGRGIGKILQVCRDAGMVDPEWRCEMQGLWVEFVKRDHVGTKLGLSPEQMVVSRKCLSKKGISELMEAVDRKNRTKFRDQVLKPLLEAGIIEMTLPDTPRSPKQQYQLTVRGRAVVDNIDRGGQAS